MINVQKAGDRTAIVISFICVIHCLTLPVLLAAVPALAGVALFSDEAFHQWLLVAILPISILALAMGYRHHRGASAVWVGVLGLIVLASSAFFGHDLLGHSGEIAVTVLGSLMVAWAHIKNFRFHSESEA